MPSWIFQARARRLGAGNLRAVLAWSLATVLSSLPSAACGPSDATEPTNHGGAAESASTGDASPAAIGPDSTATPRGPDTGAASGKDAGPTRTDGGALPLDASAQEAEAGATTPPTDAAHGGSVDAAAPAADAGTDASSGDVCADGPRVETPFGCNFAWGTNDPDPSSPLSGIERLGFVTKWVGYEVDKDGSLPRCDGCKWLPGLESGSTLPVYYAYFIGYLGSANGFADQNVNPNGPNLATDGAQLIRAQRDKILSMYASYAKQSAEAWPGKPLVWLLEGDFVQYTYEQQKQALSMDELALLARDITCAIKGSMPKAVVAINHSTWLADDVTNAFWEAMARANVAYDLVWTTGVADNMGFLERDAKPGIYNEATATYAYLAHKTGRKLLVDTSFGLSAMSDSWTTSAPSVLNARIADGVIAVNVTAPASDYVSVSEALSTKLDPVCQ